jgi:hypothetical protein
MLPFFLVPTVAISLHFIQSFDESIKPSHSYDVGLAESNASATFYIDTAVFAPQKCTHFAINLLSIGRTLNKHIPGTLVH